MFLDNKEKLCFEEQLGDLFQVPNNVSLAHCVSTDMEMGKGIAVEFKDRFGRVDELLNRSKFKNEKKSDLLFHFLINL